MGAVSWIGDLVGFFGSLIPRWELIRETHGAVRYGPGGSVPFQGAGLLFWWPAIHEIEVIPVVTQTLDLPCQHLDGRSVAFIVTYEVIDVGLALTKQWDLEDTIRDTVMSHTAGWLEDPQQGEEDLGEAMRPFGIHLTSLALRVDTASTVIAHLGGGSAVLGETDYED